jgi:hypothetical protein
VDSIKELAGASKNPASTLRLYPGADHGIELFTAHEDLQPLIVSWMKAQFY